MSMGEHHYLTNQLLIAMPSLADPNFSQTVTLVCEHTDKGALGVILNRPLDMRLGEVLDQLSLPNRNPRLAEQMVLRGGPVQPDRGFVLHHPTGREWDSTLEVSDGLHVTTSRDILEAMAQGDGPTEATMALGYAGWDAGQLESEMLANSWLNVPATPEIVFDTPFAERWGYAARTLGIDIAAMGTDAGHA